MNIFDIYKKYFLRVNFIILVTILTFFVLLFRQTPIKEDKVLELKSGNTEVVSFEDLKHRFEKVASDAGPQEAVSILEQESLENEEIFKKALEYMNRRLSGDEQWQYLTIQG